MAQAAKDGVVSSDMKPIDYRAATRRLGTIPGKKTKQQKIAKEIGDVYNACETIHGVDKTAAQMYMKLAGMDEGDRLKTFRDLNGLLDAGGMVSEDSDLVDKAEGNIVRFRFRPEAEDDQSNGTIEEEPEGMEDVEEDVLASEQPDADVYKDDEFQEATDEELEQQTGRAEASAKRRAAQAVKADPKEPYTGDNADLAGEE